MKVELQKIKMVILPTVRPDSCRRVLRIMTVLKEQTTGG